MKHINPPTESNTVIDSGTVKPATPTYNIHPISRDRTPQSSAEQTCHHFEVALCILYPRVTYVSTEKVTGGEYVQILHVTKS